MNLTKTYKLMEHILKIDEKMEVTNNNQGKPTNEETSRIFMQYWGQIIVYRTKNIKWE